MHTRDALGLVRLFSGLSASHLDRLAAIVVRRTVDKGQDIFHEGDPGLGFFSIVSGKIKVFKTSMAGKEHIIHILGPGESFAEVAVFSKLNYPANAQAMEQTDLLFIPRDGLKTCLAADPELAMNMFGLLASRLLHFVRKVEELSLKEVPARLAAHLLLLRDAAGEANGAPSDTVQLDMTKGHLAGYLGTIPETLSRILKKMDEARLVTTKGKTLTLLDPDALERLASGQDRLE
ncbi:MAG: Crp/Fnr family transcriptional regulator [Desulfovibrionaceae bacterium]